MQQNYEANLSFLENIYRKGEQQGHAFICLPPSIPIYEVGDYTSKRKPIREYLPWVLENYRRQVDFFEACGCDGVPVASLMTGTHIYAAAFGCPVHEFPDSNPCALPLLSSAKEADKLPEIEVRQSPGLQRIFELAEALRSELGKDVFLGPPDIQSGFDTAALVWSKSEFLCAMRDEEEKDSVKRLTDKCARLLKNFLKEFRREFPLTSPCHCPSGAWAPPEMGPWVSNDECGAFSNADFEEFCLPELIDLSETFGGLGMHCCASAEHQFESFKKIPNFYAFNRVKAQRGYAPILSAFDGQESPVFTLAWLEDSEIIELLQKASPWHRFVFVKTGCEIEEAKIWLEKMRSISARINA
ncbi:MAG: hypothetical protein A2X49_16700 [Lentisphaerae bacterium GWF2_52_8]|nr:MAG: hypothetical protein A2X49_16700 [Lentisphaerae bacterium GWF2_52_8]